MVVENSTLRGTLAVFFAALMLLSGVAMPVASGGAVAVSEAQDDNSTDSGDASVTIVGADASSDESSQHPSQYNDEGEFDSSDAYETDSIPPVDENYEDVAKGTLDDFDELLSESGHATFSPNFNDNLAVGVATHSVSSNQEYALGIDYNVPEGTELKVTPVKAGGEPIENSYILTGEGDAVSNIPLSDEEANHVRDSGELLLVYTTCGGNGAIQVSEQKVVASPDEKDGAKFEATSLDQTELACDHTTEETEPPVADFTISGENGDGEFLTGEELTFNAGDSENPNGPDSDLTYSWSGAVNDVGETTSKSFSTSGTYTVSLTVTLGSEKDSIEKTFSVDTEDTSPPPSSSPSPSPSPSPGPEPPDEGDDGDDEPPAAPPLEDPVAEISVSDEFGSNYYSSETLTFSGGDSYSPNGDIVDYEWDFTIISRSDRGAVDVNDGYTSSGVTESISPSSSGAITATLTVTDSEGQTDSTRRTITVSDSPSPNADIDASFYCGEFSSQCGSSGNTYTVVEGTEVYFDGSDSSSPVGSIDEYDWSFAGGFVDSSSLAPSRVYTEPGRYTVSLTVTDSEGLSDREVATVRVIEAGAQSDYSPSIDSLDVKPTDEGNNIYEVEVSVTHPGDDKVTTRLDFQELGITNQLTHPEGSTSDGHTDSVTVAYENEDSSIMNGEGEQETVIEATAEDTSGDTDTTSTSEEVVWLESTSEGNSNVNSDISASEVGVGETVSIEAGCTVSGHAGAGPCSVSIAWGDGTTSTVSAEDQMDEGSSWSAETRSHSYDSAGEYTIEIREASGGLLSGGSYTNDFYTITVTGEDDGGGVGGELPSDCEDANNNGICDDREYIEYHWQKYVTETETTVSDEKPDSEWERVRVDHYKTEETDDTQEIRADNPYSHSIIPEHWDHVGTTTNTETSYETEVSADRPSGDGWGIDERNVDTTTETYTDYFWSEHRQTSQLSPTVTYTGDTRLVERATTETEVSADRPSGSGWSIDERTVDTTTETYTDHFWSESRHASRLSPTVTYTGDSRTVQDGYNYEWRSSPGGYDYVDTRTTYDTETYTYRTRVRNSYTTRVRNSYTTRSCSWEYSVYGGYYRSCSTETNYYYTTETNYYYTWETRTGTRTVTDTEYRVKIPQYTTEYKFASEETREIDQHRWERETTEMVTEYKFASEETREIDQHRWEREVEEEVFYDVYAVVERVPYYEWERETRTVEEVTTAYRPNTQMNDMAGSYTRHHHICGEDPGVLEAEKCDIGGGGAGGTGTSSETELLR